MNSGDRVAQGSYAPRATAKIVASLGLAGLGLPWNNHQGSGVMWSRGTADWLGWAVGGPPQLGNSPLMLQRSLQELNPETTLSTMAQRNILFAFLVWWWCFN